MGLGLQKQAQRDLAARLIRVFFATKVAQQQRSASLGSSSLGNDISSPGNDILRPSLYFGISR